MIYRFDRLKESFEQNLFAFTLTARDLRDPSSLQHLYFTGVRLHLLRCFVPVTARVFWSNTVTRLPPPTSGSSLVLQPVSHDEHHFSHSRVTSRLRNGVSGACGPAHPLIRIDKRKLDEALIRKTLFWITLPFLGQNIWMKLRRTNVPPTAP